MGNNVIFFFFFRNLQSWALRQYKFYFLSYEDSLLHLNKILHSNLRDGSFPSFLWVVTSHLPWSLCSQGGKGEWERKLFFASLFDCMWNVEWKWACLFLIFFSCMGYDVLVKTYTGKKKIKNRELQLCQTFHVQSERLEVKWLSLPLLSSDNGSAFKNSLFTHMLCKKESAFWIKTCFKYFPKL